MNKEGLKDSIKVEYDTKSTTITIVENGNNHTFSGDHDSVIKRALEFLEKHPELNREFKDKFVFHCLNWWNDIGPRCKVQCEECLHDDVDS